MRFILGLIIGIGIVIGGAYIHDSTDSGSAKPLVNWTNTAEFERNTYDYLKSQFDRLVNWLTSSSSK